MNEAVYAVVGIPAIAGLILALIPGYRISAIGNVFASGLTFTASLSFLAMHPVVENYVILDSLNTFFIILNTLVGFTTSAFSASYIGHEIETGHLTPLFVRFYHALFQGMMASMNMALLANNIGVMWVGLELATLMTVVMVGIYRTPSALEAAWKYFILGIVGISLAFFGTILVYLAGQGVLGEGLPAMTWSRLLASAPQLDAALLNLAFIFLLVGYGTKVGLAPLHAWLPDAHAEGPTPISAVLSGLLLNVALFALLRFKMLIAAHPGALKPGPIMIAIGLLSLIFAAFMLYQRRDIKRLFAYSSIEHMGLITFAFGMGGPLANFAGTASHGHAQPDQIGDLFRGRTCGAGEGHPAARRHQGLERVASGARGRACLRRDRDFGFAPLWSFHERVPDPNVDIRTRPAACTRRGVRPARRVRSAFLEAAKCSVRRPSTPDHKVNASSLPLIVHLTLVLVAGLYIPAALVSWFQRAAELLG